MSQSSISRGGDLLAPLKELHAPSSSHVEQSPAENQPIRTSPPSSLAQDPNDLLFSEATWRQHLSRWSDDLRVPDSHQPRVHMSQFRNWVLELQDAHKRQALEIRHLEEEVQFADDDLRQYIKFFSMFVQNAFNRYDALIATERRIPLDSLDVPITIAQEAEFLWTVDAYGFITEQIAALQERLLGAPTALTDSQAPAPTVINPSGKIKWATDETTSSRIRRWNARNTDRLVNKTASRQNPAIPNAVTETSSLAPHKATLATLAAIAFFGASISWSAVFTGARGNLVILAWASAVFIAGATAAGSMGIITESDRIDLERDMGARRAIRAFGLVSGFFTICGILLMGIATLGVIPSYAAPINDYPPSSGSRVGMIAAGGFVVGIVVLEVGIAIYVRVHYHRGPYVW